MNKHTKSSIDASFKKTADKSADDKLSEDLKELLANVSAYISDCIIITQANPIDDNGSKVVYVNKAFEEMTGFSAEDILNKTPRILQGPSTCKKELSILRKAIKDGKKCEVTLVNYKKSGEKFWNNIKLDPIYDSTNKLSYLIAIERDVTPYQNELIRKELFFKISSAFKQHQSLEECIHSVCEILGNLEDICLAEFWEPQTEHQLIKLTSNYFEHPSMHVFYELSNHLDSFLINKGIPGIVFQKQKILQWDFDKNSTEFIRIDAALECGIKTVIGIPSLYEEKTEGVFLLASTLEAKEIEYYNQVFSELIYFIGSEIHKKKLEKKYEVLFNFSPQPIWLYDSTTLKFLKVNHAAVEKYGFTEEEFLELTLNDILLKTNPVQSKSIFKSNQHQLKSGQVIDVVEHKQTIFIDGKSVELSLIDDVTENLRRIHIIEQQNQQLKKIAWKHSHEVRAPIARVLGLIDLLDNELISNEEFSTVIQHIKSSVEELDEVVAIITRYTAIYNDFTGNN